MSMWDWMSNFASAVRDLAEEHRSWSEPTRINPGTNLPMIGGSNVDVAGNAFGASPQQSWDQHNSPWDHHWHDTPVGGLSNGYDPTRGW